MYRTFLVKVKVNLVVSDRFDRDLCLRACVRFITIRVSHWMPNLNREQRQMLAQTRLLATTEYSISARAPVDTTTWYYGADVPVADVEERVGAHIQIPPCPQSHRVTSAEGPRRDLKT
jgi:hypothetical protein